MEQQEEFSKYRIFIFRAYQYESMNLLNQRKADLAITVSKDLRSPALLRELKERGLEYHTICELPACVRLSKNHPLTKEPSGLFQKLKDYPFVNLYYPPGACLFLQPLSRNTVYQLVKIDLC